MDEGRWFYEPQMTLNSNREMISLSPLSEADLYLFVLAIRQRQKVVRCLDDRSTSIYNSRGLKMFCGQGIFAGRQILREKAKDRTRYKGLQIIPVSRERNWLKFFLNIRESCHISCT